ncbi:MAG: hypothetical protein M3Z01_02870 [Thermoproteota archaeon]|nr:hypothetical protein [Thermoproteota archaeon]
MFLFTSLVVGYSFISNKVFGDGLFMEQLFASFGDRQADLLIKMTPPVITTEMTQKPMIEFKLFDAKTNQTFKGVTYFITIEKHGKQLLSNRFYNSGGDLKIQIQPKKFKQHYYL